MQPKELSSHKFTSKSMQLIKLDTACIKMWLITLN